MVARQGEGGSYLPLSRVQDPDRDVASGLGIDLILLQDEETTPTAPEDVGEGPIGGVPIRVFPRRRRMAQVPHDLVPGGGEPGIELLESLAVSRALMVPAYRGLRRRSVLLIRPVAQGHPEVGPAVESS